MLVFATDFPVKDGMASQEFLESIQISLLGSQQTTLVEEDFRNLFVTHEVKAVERLGQKLELVRSFSEADEAIAVRYTNPDDDHNNSWVTNAVFSKTERDTWIGIRIFCESRLLSNHKPEAKTTILIKTLFEKFGGALDGELITSIEPIWLQESDIELVARLISGQSKHRLPVVYVSVGFQGEPIFDSRDDIPKLANDLCGMAHIFVEPSRLFSKRLRNKVDSKNVYGGTVGIYWPDGGGHRSFFLGDQFQSPQDIFDAVCEEVRVALINRRALERCTWSYVQKAQSRRKIEGLKISKSQEVDEYIESFDRELEAMTNKLRDAEKEIKRLKLEICDYESGLSRAGRLTFRVGKEENLYENEIFEIVRDAASDKLKNLDPKKYIRRVHVLQSFIDANAEVRTLSASKREQLKAVLKGYTRMDKKTRKGLLDLGFSVSEDGKHYKLTFQGDDRYTFSIPKSGSDNRGGLNAASTLGHMFF